MKTSKVTLSIDEVKHIAQLARLKLTPNELKKFKVQLSSVLDYVSQLSKVETQKVEPTSQVTGLENIFRDDRTRPSLTQEETLSGAQQVKNGFFKVKAIFG